MRELNICRGSVVNRIVAAWLVLKASARVPKSGTDFLSRAVGNKSPKPSVVVVDDKVVEDPSPPASSNTCWNWKKLLLPYLTKGICNELIMKRQCPVLGEVC